MFVKPPYLIRKLYPQLVWKVDTVEKVLYLTFDDGPHPDITPKVISILGEYNAKATFFCIGDNVEKFPDTFKLIIKKGHKVANHTYHHLNGWKTVNDAYFSDIDHCSKVVDSYLFRPPYGRITHFQIAHLKMTFRIIMWSVLSYDFAKKTSPEKCLNNVVRLSGPGSIIVFHDSLKASKNMLFALPRVLKYFSEKGYRFEALKVQA